jgi:hypothetical protein
VPDKGVRAAPDAGGAPLFVWTARELRTTHAYMRLGAAGGAGAGAGGGAGGTATPGSAAAATTAADEAAFLARGERAEG